MLFRTESSNIFSHQKYQISFDDIRLIFNSIPWQLFISNPIHSENSIVIQEIYNKFPTVSIFKSLVLPFFIYIPTERALGRELEERGVLQTICDFLPGEIPSRGTLWNFRRKYQNEYPKILLQILIAICLNSEIPRSKIPYAEFISEDKLAKIGETIQYFYSSTQIKYQSPIDHESYKVEIWRSIGRTEKPSSEIKPDIQKKKYSELSNVNNWLKWQEVMMRHIDYSDKDKSWFSRDLGLPVFVKATTKNNEIALKLDAPEWLEKQGRDKDTIIGLESTSIPYIACNILVIRNKNNMNCLLLSKRRHGFGEGTYALPGGKIKPGETIEECAIRELMEETTMELFKSRPISVKVTHFPNNPWVLSIGVLAEKFTGNPKTIESFQHDEWQWYSMADLPKPLFEPARLVIAQYLSGVYSNILWNDLEDIMQTKIEQLSLF